jgi:myosin heavy subunit
VSGVDDAEGFKTVREALKVMEIGDEEQQALYLLLSVIIHLGNIEFASGDGGRARITNPDLVSTIAKVWILLFCLPGGKKPVSVKLFSFFFLF